MIHTNGQTYRNDLHRELHELLCSEADQRDQREGITWIKIERQAMCDAVNRHRARLRKAPVAVEDVERVETSASGHTDYGTKFALYCTELVENRA